MDRTHQITQEAREFKSANTFRVVKKTKREPNSQNGEVVEIKEEITYATRKEGCGHVLREVHRYAGPSTAGTSTYLDGIRASDDRYDRHIHNGHDRAHGPDLEIETAEPILLN